MSTIEKKKFKTTPLRVFMFVFLILWSLTFGICLLWLVSNSLKNRVEYLMDPVGLPTVFRWRNYLDTFVQLQSTGKNLIVMLVNTMWLTFGNIFLQTISALTFTYVVARFKFPGRDAIYWVVIARMMITLVGTMPGTYRLYIDLGIYDSPLILITQLSGTANFLIYYATWKGVPNSYAEAGYMDGAGHIRIFFSVMLPQIKGIVLATAITSFIANWNEYMFPLLYLPSYPTIASGIYSYQVEFARQLNYPMLFAALTMTMIPCIAVFCIFQENFLSINIGGGLKG